ncbi:MAG: diacylglycerol kinase family protein [Angelakisella sp.]
MKHIFIINPQAGSGNAAKWLPEKIAAAFADAPELCELYLTQKEGDATDYVVRRCQAEADGESLCFYACGGDGTLNEVAEGTLRFPFAQVGVVPCGTGNDFVKNFPDRNFLDIAAQRDGEPMTIDLLHCNGRIAVNLCNAGLDANVARDIHIFKRLPLLGGPSAYIVSLVKNFFGRLGEQAVVRLDGVEITTGSLLLLVIANGKYYGGSFTGAPEASVEDGLIDVSIVPTLSRPKILSVLPRYQKGRHTTDEDLRRIVTYRKCSKIEVEYSRPVSLCIDGESMITSRITATVAQGGLHVHLPAVHARAASPATVTV